MAHRAVEGHFTAGRWRYRDCDSDRSRRPGVSDLKQDRSEALQAPHCCRAVYWTEPCLKICGKPRSGLNGKSHEIPLWVSSGCHAREQFRCLIGEAMHKLDIAPLHVAEIIEPL
jgi:hypothetical protein